MVDRSVFSGRTLVYGPPASGKNFLALDLAMTMARAAVEPSAPSLWFRQPIPRSQATLVTDDSVDVRRYRMKAWALRNGAVLADLPVFFAVLPAPTELRSAAQRAHFFQSLPAGPLIVTAPVVENSTLRGADRMVDLFSEFDAWVSVNGSEGGRLNNWNIARGRLPFSYQRRYFRLRPFESGVDDDGPVSSCYVEPILWSRADG